MGGPLGCGGESALSWIGDCSASWADFWAMELRVWMLEDCLAGLLGSEVSLGTLVRASRIGMTSLVFLCTLCIVVHVVSQLSHRVVAAVVIIVADCIAVSPLPMIASHRCCCCCCCDVFVFILLACTR